MRFIAFLIVCVFFGAGAKAGEQAILQLDTGGHMAIVRSVVFTPDGKFIVSAADDKVIRVWDLAAGRTVRTIRGQSRPGQEGKIFAMALSPDGRWLAAAGWMDRSSARLPCCGDIRLYDFKSGELVALLKGHTSIVNSLAFSPDSKKLLSGGGDSDAILWDVAEAKLLHRLHGHRSDVYAVAFTPDSARAVTGSYDKTLRLWNVADGALLKEMTGHAEKIHALTVSRNGVIASGDEGGEIRLWDARTGAFTKVLGNQDSWVGSLSFTPNGRMLLSTCGGGPACATRPQIVWDTTNGQRVLQLEKHDNVVIATAVSPDGTLAATGGGEDRSINVWDIKTGATKVVLKGTGRRPWAVGFSPDGRSIAWGNTWAYVDPTAHGQLEMAFRWPGPDATLARPEPVTSQQGWIRGKGSFGAFSLNVRKGGDYGYGDAVLDILKDGKVAVSITRGPVDGYGHSAYTFTPDGTQIISGGGNGKLIAYGLDGKVLGEFEGHESDVWAVAASADGNYLVSGSGDQTVRLWNLKTRELLVTIFRGSDGEWVMWTPEGFYTGSAGAAKIVGWQINQGPDKPARYITAGQLRKVLYRPDLVAAKIAGDPDGLLRAAAASLDIDKLISRALAPEAAILSPANGAKLGDANVAVTVRVTDQGGGIGNIVFKLNGQRVGSAYGAIMLGKDGTLTRRFDLATRDTKIEVVAEDKSGKVQSLPAVAEVHIDPKAILGVPDLYVFAIGADHYRDRSKSLNFAVSDAEALAEALKEAGAGYYRHPPIVKTLFDGDVTTEKVETAFKELGARVKATDVFLFYMAGHGKTIQGDYYYLPPDMDRFSEDAIKHMGFGPEKLAQWFETIKAQKSIWIFDTCESGSAGKLFRVRDATADEAAYQRMKDATGRTLFMAASEQQSAIEGYRNHGLFTYALLEGLAKAGRTDKVELFDLADYVETRVPELSRLLKACDARGPSEYCQKPIVGLGNTPNYPLLPRYPKVLAMLGGDAPQIGTKPTHVVLAPASVFEAPDPNAASKRQLKRGDQVTALKIEHGWVHAAQNGLPIGFVEESKLLELNN